jgi:hypothetical protein
VVDILKELVISTYPSIVRYIAGSIQGGQKRYFGEKEGNEATLHILLLSPNAQNARHPRPW